MVNVFLFLLYHQAELWFSSESVEPVPEDPSEPPPYDRLANLRKVSTCNA